MTLKLVAERVNVPAATINYLVHVDEERKVAYFETPKVACTSIKKFMQDQYFGGHRTLDNPNLVHDRAQSPLMALKDLSASAQEAVLWGEFRRFTFVRNPFSRVLSGYLDKIITNEWERERHLPKLGFSTDVYPSFVEFLDALNGIDDAKRDIHFMTQRRILMNNEVKFDFVGAFENFAADFHQLKIGLFQVDAEDDYSAFGKHHATGASDKIKKYITPEAETLVRKIYSDDFVMAGYRPDLSASHLVPDFHHALLATGVRASWLCLPATLPLAGHHYVSGLNRAKSAAKFEDTRALSLLSELLHSLPGDPSVVHRRCQLLLNKGEAETALQEAQAALQHTPQFPGLMIQSARAFRQLGRLDDAESVLKELRQAHPRNPVGYSEHAIIALDRGDIATATRLLEEALDHADFPAWSDQSFSDLFQRALVEFDLPKIQALQTQHENRIQSRK